LRGIEPDSEESWIEWFCMKKGNEFFCEVDQQFIMDDFNLFDLRDFIDYYEEALYLILDMED